MDSILEILPPDYSACGRSVRKEVLYAGGLLLTKLGHEFPVSPW